MTLTEASYYSRKLLPVGAILFLVLIIFFFSFKIMSIYLSSQDNDSEGNPTQEQTAPVLTDEKFGSITPLDIPNAKSPASFKLVLDTLDGTTNIENATSAAQVYFIPQQTASFGFLSRIYSMAEKVGIDTTITEHDLRDKIAVFDDGRRKLTIDIRTFNFSYDYTITNEDNISPQQNDDIESPLISSATAFLTELDRYPTALTQGDRNVIYMNLDPETKEVATLDSAKNANLAEVDFFSQDVDGLPVVTSSYYNSPNFVMFIISGGQYKPIRAKISYFEKSQDQIGTYPLKTSQEAWDDISRGKGYVVSSLSNDGEVKIEKIILAYFEPDTYQEYMQPVYVFLGQNRFVAYIEAVKNDFISDQAE